MTSCQPYFTVCRNIHGKTALELANTAEVRAALQEPALQQHHVRDLPEVSTAVSLFSHFTSALLLVSRVGLLWLQPEFSDQISFRKQ